MTIYDLVFAPFLRHVPRALISRFQAFVQLGGKLILGPMTGDRTQEMSLPETNGLGGIGRWLHLDDVHQFSVHPQTMVADSDKGPVESTDTITLFNVPSTWTVEIQAPNRQTIVGSTKLGKGTVTYLGALPASFEDVWWLSFVSEHILQADQDRNNLLITKGLVKYRRDSLDASYYFVANMTAETGEIQIKANGFDQPVGQQIRLEGFSHITLRRQRD